MREVVIASLVYDLETVKKAAYRFIDKAAPDISIRNGDILCTFTFTRGTSAAAADLFVQEFRSELLDQDLRKKIAAETAPMRNAILALAFAAAKPQSSE